MRLQKENRKVTSYPELFDYLKDEWFILEQLANTWCITFEKAKESDDWRFLYFYWGIDYEQIAISEIFLPESWLFEFLWDNDMIDEDVLYNLYRLPTSYILNAENSPEIERDDPRFWAMYFAEQESSVARKRILLDAIK